MKALSYLYSERLYNPFTPCFSMISSTRADPIGAGDAAVFLVPKEQMQVVRIKLIRVPGEPGAFANRAKCDLTGDSDHFHDNAEPFVRRAVDIELIVLDQPELFEPGKGGGHFPA